MRLRPISGFVRNTREHGRSIAWPSKIMGNINLVEDMLDVSLGPDGQCKRWERQRMAMQDKNEHRPRRFLERRRKAQVDHDDKLAALVKLLLRWGRLLKKDAAFALRERQKVVRQHMNDKKERKRFEVSEKRRLRAEERLRRENLRKTMKSDLIFLDLGKKVLGEK